jgi:hypothetical protein
MGVKNAEFQHGILIFFYKNNLKIILALFLNFEAECKKGSKNLNKKHI